MDAQTDRERRPLLLGWLRMLLGPLITMVTGAALVLTPLIFRAPSSARVLDGNLPVNIGATDLRDLTGHNSPALARNPRNGANLIVANRIDTPAFSCALHVSFDGGAGWSQTPLPVPPGEEPKCFAPDIAFSPDGTLYLAFVTLKGDQNVPNAVWISNSTDGGRSVSDPVRALGPLSFQVRLSADPVKPGVLYLTWLKAEATAIFAFPQTGYPIQVATSTDGGATWGDPGRVSPPQRERVVAPTPVVTRSGLYVLYLDLLDDRLDYAGGHRGEGGDPYAGAWQLVLARSSDGARWTESIVERRLIPTERFVVFIPPFPTLAVDEENGAVFAAFQHGKSGDADVWAWTSTNSGRSFSPGVRVNDTRVKDGTSQYLPKLAVAPSGRLDVVYYDRRADPKNIMNETSLQSSFDGGKTFEPRVRLSDIPFDSRIGFGRERGLPDLGTRLGLISSESRALAVWPDTRAGSEAAIKQDLVRALVQINPPASMPRALQSGLRVAGGALILAGISWFLARALRSRRRGES